MASDTTRIQWREDTRGEPFPGEENNFFQDKFTVKDVLRMFHITLGGSEGGEEGVEDLKDIHHDRLGQILDMIREEDIDAIEHHHLVSSRLHLPITAPSSQILVVASNSATLAALFATCDRAREKKEVMVHPVVREAYRRMLLDKAIPNSTFKRLPQTFPSPAPTRAEVLTSRVMRMFYAYYGPDKARPTYPILPPRERPPPPPEPEPKPKKKGKKGKGGKKKKKDKNKAPPGPLDMVAWRKETLPVASCRLFEPYFPPTPPSSQPPTPPGELPEPESCFGYFINSVPGSECQRKDRRGSSRKYVQPCASPSPSFIPAHRHPSPNGEGWGGGGGGSVGAEGGGVWGTSSDTRAGRFPASISGIGIAITTTTSSTTTEKAGGMSGGGVGENYYRKDGLLAV